MVNDSEDTAAVDVDAAKQKLSDGLKTCHSVVKDYRSMLEGEAAVTPEPEDEPIDRE